MIKDLVCDKCKGTSFKFRWEIKDEAEDMKLIWMHDGIGYELKAAIITCASCGEESEYDFEDFLKVIKREG